MKDTRTYLDIRKGDMVVVVSGKDKGAKGKVIRTIPAEHKVLVEGVNMVSKNMRPTQEMPQGRIAKREAPILASKVMLVCPQCGAATRVGCSFLESGKKVRVCRKCSEIIDRA